MKNNGKLKKSGWILWVLFLLGPLASGQEARVVIKPNPPEVNRKLTIRFELHNHSMQNFRPPEFPDTWKMLGGPVQGPSQTIVNGKLHYKEMVQYTFIPGQPGTFQLGTALFSSKGKKVFRTQARAVEILSREDALQRKEKLQQEKDARLRQSLRKDLFIRATASRKSVYKGEQLVISYKLYSRVNFTLRDWVQMPQLTGFWTEELETTSQRTRTTLNGKPYTVIELKKLVAFPQVSGTLKVDPLELKMVAAVPQSRGDGDAPFGGFSSIFGRTRKLELSVASPPLNIEVKPLPPGAPQGFEGLVGQFDWEARFGNDTLGVGDGYHVDIEVSGAGNLAPLQAFTLDLPASLEQYDPQLEKSSRFYKNKWVGKKHFTYLLIPRQSGEYTIPPIRMVYFDPQQERYQVHETPRRSFAALNSAGTLAGKQRQLPVQAGNEVPTLQETIRDIKRNNQAGPGFEQWGPDQLRFWLAYGAPVVLLVVAGGLRHFLPRMAGDRHHRQYRRLKQRLQHLHQLDTEQQLAGIEKALDEYLFLRYQIQASTMSREEQQRAMRRQGIPENQQHEWFRIREHLNYLRYAPDQSAQDIGKLRQAALAWIQPPQAKQSA